MTYRDTSATDLRGPPGTCPDCRNQETWVSLRSDDRDTLRPKTDLKAASRMKAHEIERDFLASLSRRRR